MTTYGNMQDRIADELDRTDLTSQIQKAIQTAIDAYEKRRFWFNESRALTFNTVANQEFYGSSDATDLPNLIFIDTVKLSLTATEKVELDRVPYEELEHESDNLTADGGQPTCYAWYASQMRLYPIPDAAYAVRVSGVFALSDLSATADTNAWMTDAEVLIRSRAKREIYTHLLRDLEGAGIMAQAEMSALKELIEVNNSRKSTGSIVPSDF